MVGGGSPVPPDQWGLQNPPLSLGQAGFLSLTFWEAAVTCPRRGLTAGSPESHASQAEPLLQSPFPGGASPSVGLESHTQPLSSLADGPQPSHSPCSCLVRRPGCRGGRAAGRSGAWADVLMKNLQGIIRGSCAFPSGHPQPPRAVAQAPASRLKNAPVVLKKIWLWGLLPGV